VATQLAKSRYADTPACKVGSSSQTPTQLRSPWVHFCVHASNDWHVAPQDMAELQQVETMQGSQYTLVLMTRNSAPPQVPGAAPVPVPAPESP